MKLHLHPSIGLHSRKLTFDKHNLNICTLFPVPGTWLVNYGPCNEDHLSEDDKFQFEKSEVAARVLNTCARVFVQHFPGALPW